MRRGERLGRGEKTASGTGEATRCSLVELELIHGCRGELGGTVGPRGEGRRAAEVGRRPGGGAGQEVEGGGPALKTPPAQRNRSREGRIHRPRREGEGIGRRWGPAVVVLSLTVEWG